MRSGWSSSSVVQAMSVPVEKVQPRPQSTWVIRMRGNAVTKPIMSMPVPMTRWATTIDYLWLTTSAMTPVGISATSIVKARTAP